MSPELVHVDILLRRVETLERQNRRIKRSGAAALLCVVALMLVGWMSAYEQQTYEGRFLLKDQNGTLKGAMLTDPQTGLGGFFIGTSTAEKTTSQDNATVTTKIATQPHINIGYRKDNGEPYITIFDRAGQVRVSLGVDGAGESHLELYDRKGGLMWKAK